MTISMRAARVNAEMTRVEAAAALGISANTLSNYEHGKTTPSARVAQKMAEVYKQPIENINFFNVKLCLKPNEETE